MNLNYFHALTISKPIDSTSFQVRVDINLVKLNISQFSWIFTILVVNFRVQIFNYPEEKEILVAFKTARVLMVGGGALVIH